MPVSGRCARDRLGSGGSPQRPGPCADRGGVTVEAAIGLSAVMVVLVLCLGAVAALTAQLRCQDAAQQAARLAGRGDEEGARAAVAALAPDGATVSLTVAGDLVTATVQAPNLVAALPVGTLRASAVAAREEGVGP